MDTVSANVRMPAIGVVTLDDATWQGEQLILGTVPAGLAEAATT